MDPQIVPVRLFIDTPEGLIPLGRSTSSIPLPRGPQSRGPLLTYGPYLRAVEAFLRRGSFRAVRRVLRHHGDDTAAIEGIRDIEVTSVKHGAFYHVARVRVRTEAGSIAAALNTAVLPERQKALEAEFRLLKRLQERFPRGSLPRVYGMGSLLYRDPPGRELPMKSFLAEWFDDYHELHWSAPSESTLPGRGGSETEFEDNLPNRPRAPEELRDPGGAIESCSRAQSPLRLHVWDGSPQGTWLGDDDTFVFFRRAAAVLTDYLDDRSFRQIFPWHHAAGDFVVRLGPSGPEVRLVTARGFQRRVPRGRKPAGSRVWIGLLHFLATLTLRMRLDRLDGVGPTVWAAPPWVFPVILGFLDGWERKARGDPALPSPEEIVGVLHRLDPGEWLSILEAVLEQALVEEDEFSFLQPRLEDHAEALASSFAVGFGQGPGAVP